MSACLLLFSGFCLSLSFQWFLASPSAVCEGDDIALVWLKFQVYVIHFNHEALPSSITLKHVSEE